MRFPGATHPGAARHLDRRGAIPATVAADIGRLKRGARAACPPKPPAKAGSPPQLACFFVLLSALIAPAPILAGADRPPNILLILADDLGWNQVGYHGSTFYETPNIDRLARRGIRFTDAYSAAPICSPTRAALMTGKYPARLHLTDYIPGRLWEDKPLVTPRMQQGLPLAERTLPERLKERGYVTGLFGKWHLASDYEYKPHRPMDPETQGFDMVFHTRKPEESDIKAGKADAHNAVEITDHAVDFIRTNRSRPFFCYVAHNVVHTPLGEEAALIEKYRRKPGSKLAENIPVMAAMIERMDRGIGRLLDTLAAERLEQNTLVVFASDNGNIAAQQDQVPFRGGKATLWEGGIRVPLAIHWPGLTRPGAVSHEPVITQDLFFTLCDAAGAPTGDLPADGMSLRQHLRTAAPLGREEIFWHYPHYHHLGDMRPASVVRAGRYKLIEWHEGALLAHSPAVSLFDLVADPGENHELAGEHREVAERLHHRLRAWRKSVGAQEMTVRPESAATRPRSTAASR
ncbi:MAG: sulfatase [Opitutaceae bacterium]|nr:sulfatase [Opitutaceae bacterium]